MEILAGRGELVRVGVPVDPEHELAEIVRRSAEAGSPALLFDRVKGSKTPLVANLLATAERACQALGVGRLEELPLRTEVAAQAARRPGLARPLAIGPRQSFGPS